MEQTKTQFKLVRPAFWWATEAALGGFLGFKFSAIELYNAAKEVNLFIGSRIYTPKITLDDYMMAAEAGFQFDEFPVAGTVIHCYLSDRNFRLPEPNGFQTP